MENSTLICDHVKHILSLVCPFNCDEFWIVIFWFIESSLVIKHENMKNYFFILVIKLSLTRASKKYLSDIYIQVYVMDYNYVFYQNIKMTDESLITNKNRWETQKLQTLYLKVSFWLFTWNILHSIDLSCWTVYQWIKIRIIYHFPTFYLQSYRRFVCSDSKYNYYFPQLKKYLKQMGDNSEYRS